MIIFKDLISEDEMFTDAFLYNLVDDCLYEVECSHVVRNTPALQLEGSNPVEVGDGSQEEDFRESGFDLVLNQRLVETTFSSKNDFRDYLKRYSKELERKWNASGAPKEVVDLSKQNFIKAVKLVVPKFENFRFYLGESCHPSGLLAMLEVREVSGSRVPLMIFIKEACLYLNPATPTHPNREESFPKCVPSLVQRCETGSRKATSSLLSYLSVAFPRDQETARLSPRMVDA
ncbi:translationally-controlled tumor protein homolog [Caerostris darwini]|uniref:Translationally-controlled tumor protein homolog n=1 Tax=Caerostris darwini TaxID=1538125 RepID=A0AAV4WM59_9ARAC|nr:translationally-controlled tumor protein homolog [Caerostris darwini]